MGVVSFSLAFLIASCLVYLAISSTQSKHANKDESHVSILIWAGGLLSLSCIALLSYFLKGVEVKTTELKVSELGDAIAGFSTFLAFSWLIITVFIQAKELKNQHREMVAMNQTSSDQAESLRKTLRYQALGYMESKQSEISQYVQERLRIIGEVVVNFHKRAGIVVGPEDFFNNPEQGIEYSVSILCGTDLKFSPLKTVDPIILAETFTSDDYIFVIDLCSQIKYIRDAVRVVEKISDDLDAKDDFISWAAAMGFVWVYDHHVRIEQLRERMQHLIAQGKGAGFSQQQRQWAQAFLNKPAS